MSASFVASIDERLEITTQISSSSSSSRPTTRNPIPSNSLSSILDHRHFKEPNLTNRSSLALPLKRLLLVGGLKMPLGYREDQDLSSSSSSSSSSSFGTSSGDIGFNRGSVDHEAYKFQADYPQETLSSSSFGSQSIELQQHEQHEQSFSDWWNEYWSRQPFPSGYTQSSITLLACFISTIIFLIVVGNLLVCIAIFTEKSLKSTQNWFIASLAVSDMLLGLVVMPFSLARELMGFWIFGPLWCDIHEAIDVLLTTASINTLCLISLDRYWSITQAVSYLKKRTPRRGAFMIAFVWIFSAAVSLPPLFGWKKQTASITVSQNQTITTPQISSANRISIPMSQNDDPAVSDRSKRARSVKPQQSSNPPVGSDTDQLAKPILSSGSLKKVEILLSRSTRSSKGFLDLDSKPTSMSLRGQNEFFDSAEDQAEPDTRSFAVTPIDPAIDSSPPQSGTQITTTTTEYPSCQLSDDIGYVLYSALGSFYIPCAVMVFTYIRIFLAARSRARRTINKSNRGESHQQSSTRRHLNIGNASLHKTNQMGPTSAGNSSARLQASAISIDKSRHETRSPKERLKVGEPIVRGKIVIIERKKSVAASSLAPLGKESSDSKMEDKTRNREGSNSQNDIKVTELDNFEQTSGISASASCTITTSIAKLASTSALTSHNLDDESLDDPGRAENRNGNDLDSSSSIITVMKPSMNQVPVTRFNFQTSETERLAIQNRAEKDNKEAAALLRAISQIGDQKLDDSLIGDVMSNGSGEKPVEGNDREGALKSVEIAQKLDQEPIGMSSTNETCFMTVEEDSDMIDTQAGRTIMMIAGNSSQKHHNTMLAKDQCGMMVTMMPATSSASQSNANTCNNYTCRRQLQAATAARSGSSYCGSSMTMNDDEIGPDDCVEDEEDEDELISDEGDCNGYSISCGLEDTDFCPHCHECTEEHEDQAESSATSYIQCNRNHSSISDSPCGLMNRAVKLHHHHQSPSKQQTSHRCTDLEAQSVTGDDNASLTEYRSNDDDENESSSMIVPDPLDSSPRSRTTDKRQTNSQGGLNESRKRSIIGIRLSGIVGGGSSIKNSNQPSNSTQPTSSNQLASGVVVGQQQSGTGTRNLKALRQNFFFKLNQLTAKSSAKSSESRKSRSNSKQSLSADASTNNAQEPLETTIVDDYDVQTSEMTRYSIEGDPSAQPLGNSSDQTNESEDRQQAVAPGKLMKGPELTSQMPINQLKRGIENKSNVFSTSSGDKSGQAYEESSQTYTDRQTQRNSRKVVTLDGDQPNRSSQIASSKFSSPGPGSGGVISKRAHLPSDTERHKRKLAKARERRATLILGLIMAAFITSWLPFFTFYVTRALCVVCRDYVSPRFEAFIFWMGYCNSAINPIIYTIFNRDFRKAFRKILFRCL